MTCLKTAFALRLPSAGFDGPLVARRLREQFAEGDVNEADKEKTKLFANALNNLGVAVVTIGFVTPLIAILYEAATAPAMENLVGLSAVWLTTGVVLHLFARMLLEDLRR